MSDRLTDAEARDLTPLIVELAELIQGRGLVAARLREAQKLGAVIRQVTLDHVDVDLVKLARFIHDRGHHPV